MTITLRLPEAGPSRPSHRQSFGDQEELYNVPEALEEVVRDFRAAKRVVVVCGAGVSTAARIPDFRSGAGLFSQAGPLKDKGKGKAAGKVASIQDLFHVKSLSDETLLPAHHALLNELYELSATAEPTSFHTFLKELDKDGRLLRCYTQNIDGLEGKTGLISGTPLTSRDTKRKGPKKGSDLGIPATPKSRESSGCDPLKTPVKRVGGLFTPAGSQGVSEAVTPREMSSVSPAMLSSEEEVRSPRPPVTRVIPLHGTLMTAHCPVCAYTFDTAQSLYPLGTTLAPCPTCQHESSIREALSERSRPTGYLRPSIVLYGEDHPSGHLIGQVIERDLKGLGGKYKEGKADFLLVAGTSLSIPGVKRLVKEMSKSVRERNGVRAIFVNDQPPSTAREWEDVFNVWIQGDVQVFVQNYLANPKFATKTPDTPPKTPKGKRKKAHQDPVVSDHDAGEGSEDDILFESDIKKKRTARRPLFEVQRDSGMDHKLGASRANAVRKNENGPKRFRSTTGASAPRKIAQGLKQGSLTFAVTASRTASNDKPVGSFVNTNSAATNTPESQLAEVESRARTMSSLSPLTS